MSEMREIKKTKIAGYSHNIWEGEPIISNYAKIAAFLRTRTNLKEKYRDLLAKPVFRPGSDTVSWVTSSFDNLPPKPLPTLDAQEQDRYRSILNDYLAAYAGLIAQEPDSDGAEMLKNALVYDSENNIFCGDNQIAITGWGLFPKNSTPVDRMACYLKGQKPPSNKPVSQTTTEKDEYLSENTLEPEDTNVFDEQEELPSEIPLKPELSEDTPANNPPVVPPVFPPSSDKVVKTPENIPGNHFSDNNNDGNQGSKQNKKSFFSRNWWWLLLALLLLLLSVLLCSKCSSGRSVLPDTPGIIMPITDDDIVDSPDSLTHVVANRLNILIKDGGSIIEFAEAFKKAYPEKQYEIIYYDTLIPRVQILFPAEEKAKIREELPNRLPTFTIFIWDESLFGGEYVPNDPAMADPRKKWYFDLIKAFNAWDITQGSNDIIVAIIDDGFDLNHPEIKGNIYKPYNSMTHDNRVSASMAGHGTHVAGTAVGLSDNGVGSAGIAPRCRLMPVQVANAFGLMSTTAVIDGVLYAIMQGADVINLSLGMQFNEIIQFMPIGYQKSMIINNFLDEEKVWNEIFVLAEANHCTLVLAAGNDNILAGIDPMQRNELGIKVSAVQPDLYKALFSNYGDFSTVSAPGVEIYNAVPDNKYEFMQGTSMASPVVTGAVALLKSKDKNLTTKQVIRILQETGIDSPSNIGRIIQLDKALGAVNHPDNPEVPNTDCDAVAQRINQLQRELEQLRRQYPGCFDAAIPDTLSFPDNKIDYSSLIGRWKSTTPLFSTSGEEVTLYFDFTGTNRGRLLCLDTDGTEYHATTSLSIDGTKLIIIQDNVTKNMAGKANYPPYHFTCKPDRNRQAVCLGVNTTDSSNKINFKLIKIN